MIFLSLSSVESGIKIRKIIHIDMDAFYASVEQRDNPEWQGKPIAVGGGSERGVVATASYEARKFGVRSGMPGKQARKRCPALIFVNPRFETYSEVSRQIRAIFFEYTDAVEPLALDEAYLDVTTDEKNQGSAAKIARDIRNKIFRKTGLTASAGISVNKFLAKLASGLNKPDGQSVIRPDQIDAFLERLPIEKFYGIGKVTARKMKNEGIFTGKALKAQPLSALVEAFGKPGYYYYEVVRGIHNSPVKPDRKRKSLSVENTFLEDKVGLVSLESELKKLTLKLASRLEKNKSAGRTVTLKMKFSNFQIQTRSHTTSRFISTFHEIYPIARALLSHSNPLNSVRLLGIGVSNFKRNREKMTRLPNQLKMSF
ncbi:MAG: DNA polymerase IV [Flavobacteriales bacterium]